MLELELAKGIASGVVLTGIEVKSPHCGVATNNKNVTRIVLAGSSRKAARGAIAIYLNSEWHKA